MSTSNIQFTFRLPIATVMASSASCDPRPGRNPYENPRKPPDWGSGGRVQHHDDRALDNLVFERGDRQRPLLPVRLRYVRPAGRLRSVRSSVDPTVQAFEPKLAVCLIVLPGHPIDAGAGRALQPGERPPPAARLAPRDAPR